jgi:phosphoesterase RecJ-like protein
MDAAHDLLDSLGACRTVLLTGPTRPDGDSLGACLALQAVLRSHHVDATVTGRAAPRYRRMPGIDGLIADDALGTYDGVVVLDGDRHRLPPGATAAFASARLRGIVDHHASTRPDGYTHWWVQRRASSTCEMLFHAFQARDEVITPEIAHLLYAGLVFDTGGFRYSNTTPDTHRMAAELLEKGIDHAAICMDILMERRQAGFALLARVLGSAHADPSGRMLVAHATLADFAATSSMESDVEGTVEHLVNVEGVDVGVLVVERPDGTVKLSLRSRGAVDVATLAHALDPSGGGHAKAAGVVLSCTPADAEAGLHATLASRGRGAPWTSTT